MAIPWKALDEAGLKKDTPILNFKRRGPLTDAPNVSDGFELVSIIAGKDKPPGSFTVRLHFAELDDVTLGTRVFDVFLQGKAALKGFDIVKEAGGLRRAVMKEFKGIEAARTLALEFVPRARPAARANAPILSRIEVIAE